MLKTRALAAILTLALSAGLGCSGGGGGGGAPPPPPAPSVPADYSVLVFSETAGFRHSSIPDGIAAIQDLGARYGFAVVSSEDS